MDTVKTMLNADALAGLISLPASLVGKMVEVTVREAHNDTEDSIVEKYAGFASGLGIKAEDVKKERLAKHASAD